VIPARAVRITRPGEPEVLALADVELREPGPGELLVRVAAAGLNRADLLQRRGRYPAPGGAPPDIPGLEYAGTVQALGPAPPVTASAGASVSARARDAPFAVGERVMGIVGGGAMCTHLVVPADQVLAVPERLSLAEAAAVPEAFVTAWDALWLQGGLAAGEVALIHAAGSGIGTAALQLVRARGAVAAGTARSADKLARCAALGLQHALHVAPADREHPARFADALRAATGGRGADVILDTVGAAYLAENLAALAPRGRLVVIGLLGGAAGTLPLGALLAKRARVLGSVLRSRAPAERAALASGFARELLPLLADGTLRPVIHELLPMERVAEAHARMERDATFGKLVLTWGA
jgi:putative PIG3 family NAD(P)H quinone oxidoreductase